jgi:hypothetical protein
MEYKPFSFLAILQLKGANTIPRSLLNCYLSYHPIHGGSSYFVIDLYCYSYLFPRANASTHVAHTLSLFKEGEVY